MPGGRYGDRTGRSPQIDAMTLIIFWFFRGVVRPRLFLSCYYILYLWYVYFLMCIKHHIKKK